MRGFVCLWVQLTGTGAPDLDSSFLIGISNENIEWSGAFGNNVCIVSALPVSRCIGNVVFGKLGEELERERGQSGICSTWCYRD